MATARFFSSRPEHRPPMQSRVNAEALAKDLRRSLRGEVRFDAGSRALYATDGSNYRQPPIGVIIPRDIGDVVTALDICRAHHAPVFGRGCGTSLAGQCCNVAVCFDLSKYMNGILAIDADKRLARVQPGAILDDLRHAAERHSLTFGPDPSTHSHCTLGGMIGNNSCGVHSLMSQFDGPGTRTSDNVESLDVLTYGGVRMRVGATSEHELERLMREPGAAGGIYRALHAFIQRYAEHIRTGMPKLQRRVSGYNLDALLPEHGFNVAQALVGTESTCVLVLEATVRLVRNPRARSLLVLGYPDVYTAADHLMEILEFKPIGLEGMDDRLVEDMKRVGIHRRDLQLLPDGGGWLLVEFGGDSRAESDGRARDLMARLSSRPAAPTMKLVDDPLVEQQIWKVREAGLGATAHVSQARPTWEGWEDSAVPPARVGEYLRKLRALLDRYGYGCDLYGHFGQGCVHTRIDFDLESAAGIREFRAFVEEAATLVVSLGGSISGEHGDGQARGELLKRMYGPELMQAFRDFKSIWDPGWQMNPGKVIDAAPLDSHLRLGADYRPPRLDTHFKFPDDSGSFAKATIRCVGVGDCRRLERGTMCPSFMVTREEMHSTRGRARLLFEMLEGDPLRGGWQDEHVKEALDLCLACKGCKGDCPVSVDMATYKAEFLSHYYEQHWRPRTAYAFGLIHYWARLASLVPRLVNTATQTPVLRDVAKLVAGMPRQRRVPAFAPFTFKQWFAARPPRPQGHGPRVLLWADTFNNHFHPDTAIHASRVLERAGADVAVPAAPLCCGRPLFDYGMLDTAKTWLRDVLATLAPHIEAGTPVVVLEPSCAAVFRDELVQLFPDRSDARRLASQTVLLSEYLERTGFHYPTLARRALIHGHCHHKAVLSMDAETSALRKTGLDAEVLDSGCCGMAGSFGFERDHYDVSMKVGNRVLLPAVTEAPRDTLIVADGFSCRTQIAQATGRRALHLADVLEMASAEGPRGPAGDLPEEQYVRDYASERVPASIVVGAIAAAAAAATLLLMRGRRKRQRVAEHEEGVWHRRS
jgi:FAD/FMN-containing dehydrogenase/Fe-S oxidoreductase